MQICAPLPIKRSNPSPPFALTMRTMMTMIRMTKLTVMMMTRPSRRRKVQTWAQMEMGFFIFIMQFFSKDPARQTLQCRFYLVVTNLHQQYFYSHTHFPHEKFVLLLSKNNASTCKLTTLPISDLMECVKLIFFFFGQAIT